MRCRCILRMSTGTPRCIDWGVLGDCGEADRARAIIGEDTPWTRLFDLAELPTYRLITVEFLSTFRYQAHQAAVRVEEDAELPPDIEFSLGGQHFDMSIERFAVHLGIYYEPETVLDDFGQGLTQGEEGVMRAWWAQISDTSFTGHRVRATMIRDPLIRYIHRCIVTTISGRVQSQEWVTTTDVFICTHSLLAGRATWHGVSRCTTPPSTPFSSAVHCGVAPSSPTLLAPEAWLTCLMILRRSSLDGRPFQPAQVIVVPDQQQQDGDPMPELEPIQEEPVQSPPRGEDEPPQHPPHVYRAVRLTEPLEALLPHIAARGDDTARQMAESDRRRAAWEARVERRLNRLEDLVHWTVTVEHARRDGSQIPPFPEPPVYADDGSSAGPSGS
ncbi:hypothetical protein R6Q57_008275 [Mikania cordata]